MADEAPKPEVTPAAAPMETSVEKPGFKTTEFWICSILALAGMVMAAGLGDDSPIVKIAGMVLSLGSALGYTASRVSIKKTLQVLLVGFTLSLAVGCSQKGYVRADAIDGSLISVCDRHDKMLKGELDPKSISEADKKTYLRTSELLRKAVAEAKKDE